jgi:hypothetical protein
MGPSFQLFDQEGYVQMSLYTEPVSARVTKEMKDMIDAAGFEIRPLIEAGFETMIPSDIRVWDYILLLKDNEVADARIEMEKAQRIYEETKRKYETKLRRRDFIAKRIQDSEQQGQDNLDFLKEHRSHILSRFPIRQDAWRGDKTPVKMIRELYQRDISWDALYQAYDIISLGVSDGQIC